MQFSDCFLIPIQVCLGVLPNKIIHGKSIQSFLQVRVDRLLFPIHASILAGLQPAEAQQTTIDET